MDLISAIPNSVRRNWGVGAYEVIYMTRLLAHRRAREGHEGSKSCSGSGTLVCGAKFVLVWRLLSYRECPPLLFKLVERV